MEEKNEITELTKKLKILGINFDTYDFIYTYPPLYSLKPLQKEKDFAPEEIYQKNAENVALYFHIPFCENFCHYCYYYKVKPLPESVIVEYLEYLKKEIDIIKEFIFKNSLKISSTYIGGGTPSILPVKELEKLLNIIEDKFSFSGKEDTFECHPISLDVNKIGLLKNYGIDRVSLGVQSFNKEILCIMGRSNISIEDLKELIKKLKNAGFEKINIDLIYGLPGQTIDNVEEDINKVISLDIPSITYYRLWVKDRTSPVKPFIEFFQKSSFPAFEETLKMKIKINSLLEAKSYKEIMSSWYVKDEKYINKYQRENWTNIPYIGFGVSAYSYFNNVIFKNPCFLRQYYEKLKMNNLPICSFYKLSHQEVELRKLILGLKLEEGVEVEINNLPEEAQEKIELLEKNNFIQKIPLPEKTFTKLMLTKNGFIIADFICKYLFEKKHILPENKSIHCVCGLPRMDMWREEINVYKSKSFDVEAYDKIMNIPEEIKEEIISCVRNNINFNTECLNILSIGIGTGRLEIPIFKNLSQSYSLNVHAIDLRSQSFDKLKKNLNSYNKIKITFEERDASTFFINNIYKYHICILFNILNHLNLSDTKSLLQEIFSKIPITLISLSNGWLLDLYEEEKSDLSFVEKIKEMLSAKGIKMPNYFLYLINYLSSIYARIHIHEFTWSEKVATKDILNKNLFSFLSLFKEDEVEKIDDSKSIELPIGEILIIVKKRNYDKLNN